jgi:hypothetical protein
VCFESRRVKRHTHTPHPPNPPPQLDDYKREVQLLREENNILRAKLEGRATLHQHMMANAPM